MQKKEIERDQDIYAREKNRREERTAWYIMGLILIAALTGVFGAGPLSKKTLGSVKEGFKVEFHSLLRYKKEVPLKITARPAALENDVRIRINKDFLNAMTTVKIIPSPEVTFIGKDDYIFTFKQEGPAVQTTIALYLKPLSAGRKKLIVGEENGQSKEMEVFIYP